jgi:hypothetical protein
MYAMGEAHRTCIESGIVSWSATGEAGSRPMDGSLHFVALAMHRKQSGAAATPRLRGERNSVQRTT